MALLYYKGGIIRGLSGDTKPSTVPPFTLFIETDTLKLFLINASGTWNQFNDIVLNNSVGDAEIQAHTTTKITVPYSKLSSLAIVNADIAGAAAIAYSKLALTGGIVDADINASAAIAKSKLANLNIVNADINASAAIAYSKLSLGTSIVNADIAAGAAIAKTKLANLDIVNADVNASAAIAKTKLANLDIVNADVNASAAIAKSKLASLAIVNADVDAAAAIAWTKISKTGSLLDDLGDVVISSPATGALLRYDGTNWVVLNKGTSGQYLKVNAGATDVGWESDPALNITLNDLQDVVYTSPARGDILQFDGTDWVNIKNTWYGEKTGRWLGIGDTTATGLLEVGLTAAGTTSEVRSATEGVGRKFDDVGSTVPFGIKQTSSYYRMQWNSRIKVKSTTSASTNARWWCGFASTTTDLTGADPLNALSGVLVGATADTDTNYKVIHNDGTGATVLDDTLQTRLTTADPPTTFEIVLTSTNAKIYVNDNLTNTITTELPAATTELYPRVMAQKIGGGTKTFTAYKVLVGTL